MGNESANVQQLHVEHESGTRGNVRRSTGSPVAQIGWNYELAAAPDLHSGDAFVPPGDDLPRAQAKAEWLVAIPAAVELFSVRQPSSVVHRHSPISDGLGSLSHRDVLVSEPRRRLGELGCVYFEGSAEAGGSFGLVAIGCASAGKGASEEQEEKALQKISGGESGNFAEVRDRAGISPNRDGGI
jgi:hypothetical protein